MAMERVVEYILKHQKSPSHQLPRIACEARKNIQKTHKSTILCSSWIQDMEKLFGWWHATHLLHDASLDSFANEAFLWRQCIGTWDKCGGSCFTHYATHVAPNYKTIFFAEWENRTHRYMLEIIPLSAIRPIASRWHSSHTLRFEMGRWGRSDEFGRLCTLCLKQVWEFECHTLIQCWAFDHIFDNVFHTSLTKPNSCMNFSHNHNVPSWLQHSSVKFLNMRVATHFHMCYEKFNSFGL